MSRNLLNWGLVACTLYFSQSIATAQEAPPPDDKNGIAAVKPAFSCDEANKIKFDSAAYSALSPDERVLVDAQWNKCDFDKRRRTAAPGAPAPQTTVIVFANPAPSPSSSRVFYGLLNQRDLDNAEKNCAGAGKAAGIALTIVGAATGADETGRLGNALYQYSGVSCRGLKSSAERQDLMVFLAPNAIVSHALQDKLTKEALDKIPLISDADKKNIQKVIEKATKPPEVTVNMGKCKLRLRLEPLRSSDQNSSEVSFRRNNCDHLSRCSGDPK
jgi:hypothetical protein